MDIISDDEDHVNPESIIISGVLPDDALQIYIKCKSKFEILECCDGASQENIAILFNSSSYRQAFSLTMRRSIKAY